MNEELLRGFARGCAEFARHCERLIEASHAAAESLTLLSQDLHAIDPRRQRRCARQAFGKTATDPRRR